MKIVVNLIYDKNDRVSCPNRSKFEKRLTEFMDSFVKINMFGSIKNLDVSCFSMNLKEDQYCEIQKKN